MCPWIKQGPAGCGLDRANWTYAALTAYLYQTTDITVSETTMRTFCTTYGIRPYRPTYQYLKGDPDKQQMAHQELKVLNKKPWPAHSPCGVKMQSASPCSRRYGLHWA